MTLAEQRFKAAVRDLLAEGTYPGTTRLCRTLGFNRLRPDLNGREMRWRADVLKASGWRYVSEARGWLGQWERPTRPGSSGPGS